jgi:flagellar biosynthesis protein
MKPRPDAPLPLPRPHVDTREPRLAAVALAYRDGAAAPHVAAKGRGAVAEQIIARAREAGIYVHQSRDLVGLLMQVDLDQHIPAQLYQAVAELLAWLYRIERGLPALPLLPAPESAVNT